MKKIISSILCISLLASILCVPVSATEKAIVTESIDDFCEGISEMVTEYSDSGFVTPDFIGEDQTTKTNEEIEIKYCPRLIVQSDEPIDTYNAIDVVSGFSNFYILQFENEKDTNYAYEQYSNNDDIISVEYDISYKALLEITEDSTDEDGELTYEDYKNGWYLEATGMDMVLEKYKDQNLPEIVVAVVDTGVDLNCAYLEDRLIPTDFNNSGDGDENSEQDYYGHGTMVSSVIANCTTNNVKIANYRCFKNDGSTGGVTLACSAMLQAINKGADVVNCSFLIPDNYEFCQQILDFAYSLKCIVVAGAGNRIGNIGIHDASPLNNSEKSISVASHNKYNMPSWFTAFGKPIDILAPGEDMPLINLNNSITLTEGTSFASPFVASVYAMYIATHQTISFENIVRIIKNSGNGTDEEFATNLFGSGIINVLKLFELNTVPEPMFNMANGNYIGKVSLELFSEVNADIYYTTDYTYPTPTNGMLYTEPIVFEDEELRIRAVAYKNGKRSNYASKDICSVTLGTDNMFAINEAGVITAYTGDVKYLKIPEIINGIKVTDIAHSSGFTTAEIYGVILPDTLEYLGATYDYYERSISTNEQIGPFNGNENIQFITGENIKMIGRLGVADNPNLNYVNFPNCEYIMYRGFRNTGILGAEFPKVKTLGKEVFDGALYLREIYLPLCEKIGSNSFGNASSLSFVYMPNVNYLDFKETAPTEIIYMPESTEATQKLFTNNNELVSVDLPKMQTIGTDAFYKTPVKRLELSQVQYIYNLPNTLQQDYIGTEFYNSYYCNYYLPVSVELSLPSTLQYCVPATDYKNEFIEYIVYGTAGEKSYAEQWAIENGIEFVTISQKTAIVEDIEPIWDKYSYKPLEFDARGFNRTYQWYGSTDKIQRDSDDKLIAGATDKTFNPDNCSKSYPYYYCVMTSTDVNIKGEIVSSVDITSSMCENRLYYMFAHPNTHIDFDNKLIYTKTTASKDFLNIIGIQENTSYSSLPSLVYKEHYWYGTGSEFVIYNGTKKERYTLIVEGDIDGDSAVDVLDAFQVSLVINGHTELTDEYFLAADTNSDGELTVEDYAQVVNLVLAS